MHILNFKIDIPAKTSSWSAKSELTYAWIISYSKCMALNIEIVDELWMFIYMFDRASLIKTDLQT